mgnify:FL=1
MDEVIVNRARQGDADCFAEAVLAVKDQAYSIAYCYLRNPENAMDVVCNAVEKAFANIQKLKDPKLFKTWFIRIVINECKLHLKREKKWSILEEAESFGLQPANWDTRLDLDLLLSQLHPVDRSMIYMKYYLGYTLDEISTLTEMPLGTVKTRIYGNLKLLRQQLEKKEAYL